MVSAQFSIRMAVVLLVILIKEFLRAKENLLRTDLYTQGHLSMESKKGEEFWKYRIQPSF